MSISFYFHFISSYLSYISVFHYFTPFHLIIYTITTYNLPSVVCTHPTECKSYLVYTYIIFLLTCLLTVILIYNRSVVCTHPTEFILIYNRLWAPLSHRH